MILSKRLLWAAALVSPLFAIPIALLILDRMGVVDLPGALTCYGTCHRDMAISLVLYWLIGAIAAASVLHHRAVRSFVSRRKGPLLAMLVATVVALALAEVGLRMLGSAPEFRWPASPEFHHVNQRSGRANYRDILVRTNADGFRTEYTREEFLKYPIRVAALGDSFLFGVGVAEPDVVTNVLEQGLREALGTDDVAVLNTGVSSYSPLLERAVFRKVVVDYRPTLTLLFLDGNDIGDDHGYANESVSGDPDNPVFDRVDPGAPIDSALLRLIEPVASAFARPVDAIGSLLGLGGGENTYYDFRVNIGGVEETNRWFILRHPLELTRPYFERSFGYIQDIAREAKAIGSDFVLVVPPRYFHWSDREAPQDWAARRYAMDEPHEFAIFEFFDSVAAGAGFRIFSLLPAFQATDRFPLVFETDAHWNAAGHRFVAETVARYLLAEKLVAPK